VGAHIGQILLLPVIARTKVNMHIQLHTKAIMFWYYKFHNLGRSNKSISPKSCIFKLYLIVNKETDMPQ
jgi:hypothetical protein